MKFTDEYFDVTMTVDRIYSPFKRDAVRYAFGLNFLVLRGLNGTETRIPVGKIEFFEATPVKDAA